MCFYRITSDVIKHEMIKCAIKFLFDMAVEFINYSLFETDCFVKIKFKIRK